MSVHADAADIKRFAENTTNTTNTTSKPQGKSEKNALPSLPEYVDPNHTYVITAKPRFLKLIIEDFFTKRNIFQVKNKTVSDSSSKETFTLKFNFKTEKSLTEELRVVLSFYAHPEDSDKMILECVEKTGRDSFFSNDLFKELIKDLKKDKDSHVVDYRRKVLQTPFYNAYQSAQSTGHYQRSESSFMVDGGNGFQQTNTLNSSNS